MRAKFWLTVEEKEILEVMAKDNGCHNLLGKCEKCPFMTLDGDLGCFEHDGSMAIWLLKNAELVRR